MFEAELIIRCTYLGDTRITTTHSLVLACLVTLDPLGSPCTKIRLHRQPLRFLLGQCEDHFTLLFYHNRSCYRVHSNNSDSGFNHFLQEITFLHVHACGLIVCNIVYTYSVFAEKVVLVLRSLIFLARIES
jgi:hypothetical protein